MSSAEVSSKIQTYLPKISSATPLTLPGSSLTASRNFGLGQRERAQREEHDQGEAEAQHDRRGLLPADRLDERVGRVDPDEHEDEEEEHHHGARVDEHLRDAEEVGLLDDVEHAEVDHDERDAEGGVHGLAGEQQAERGDHHERPEDPEDDRFAGRGHRDSPIHAVGALTAPVWTTPPASSVGEAPRVPVLPSPTASPLTSPAVPVSSSF